MSTDHTNLADEFNLRVANLKEGNHFRIKQLSNFVKFYNTDKKAMVDLWRESFVNLKGDQPKIMFECLTDIISTTFYKEDPKNNENAYHVLFSKLLYEEFCWMVKKFKTKQQIEIISNLIKSWSEKKWGPYKSAIYHEDFTNYLIDILNEHKLNMEDGIYLTGLDEQIFDQYLHSKANSFIMNGLNNPLIKEYFNLDTNDKVLAMQYTNNVDKEIFIGLMNNNDPNLENRKRTVVKKYKPIFLKLKERIMEQLVRRELFIKQLLINRNNLYKDYEKAVSQKKENK